ncbi:NfeD family protein [Laspinema palackyanum]|uniref:NfeD family protein n=1 Tax=Laspinema palackyanum TaxID=3231601 RepID=UPI00345D5085|nr:NfeD family protein [Laspinema sp. D2c]
MVTDFSVVAFLTMPIQTAMTSVYSLLPMPVSPPTWWMPLFWGGTGVSFCAIEVLVRKYFGHKYKAISLIMGITALIMGAIVWHSMMVPELDWQIAYWVGLSLVSVLWLRPIFVKSRGAIAVQDATEAKTLSAILPGEVGRVIYEGSSWSAQCDDPDLAIAANQKVYVLRCEGNTLIVVPHQLFHS